MSWEKSNLDSGKIRVDAPAKTRARARYIEDMSILNLLHVATVRSPVPFGRIESIEKIQEALKMPQVLSVITARDIPGENIVPFVKRDYPCLADKEVRFHGQAVALVAAETREAARKAAALIEVICAQYDAVTDPIQAMKPGAPKIGGDDNIHSSYRIRKGDTDKAFAEADAVVEGIFRTKHQVHCYLENQGVTAVPSPGGGLDVYGSMQCPFYVHNALVVTTGLQYSKIRVVQAETGGAFGGKEDVPSILASHAAITALVTGRPASLIYDREEDFVSMSKRHPSRTTIRYAAKKDGTITGCEVEYIVDGGAFSTLSPIVAWRGTIHASGPYVIPNVKIDTYAAATNTVPCGAFRGFGQPQVSLANECLIDELADKLNMDPVQLRQKNMLKTGSLTATGQPVSESCGFEEALQGVIERIKFKRHKNAGSGVKKRGMGLSLSFYGVGLGAEGKYFAKSGAQVYVKEDGSVIVAIGTVEMGQGSENVFNRICADTLGCPYSMVEVMKTDTTRVPDSGPTVASRSTMVGGRAVMDAAGKVRDVFIKVAADMLGARPFDVRVEGGRYKTDSGEMDYYDVVKAAYLRREPVAAQGWYRVEGTTYNETTGLGNPYSVYTFSANACEVEVDTETGEVEVRKFVAAHDIGKAIHRPSAEGQIEGGVVQGIGYALYENLCLYNGRILNPTFTGYTVPTALDVCDVIPIIIESPHADGPFGAKGLGEPPIVGVAPAILNAIYDAIGIRFHHLPCLPEDIKKKLDKEI